MKKMLLVASVVSVALLYPLSSGVASAAEPISVNTQNEVSPSFVTYQVKLKVGETYQLPTGRNYKYFLYQYLDEGGPYLRVDSSGLVTALKNPRLMSGEAVGSVGIYQEGVADIGMIYFEVTG